MGELLGFFSACCYAASNVVVKKGLANIPVTYGVFIGTCVNFLIFGLMFLISIALKGLPTISLWALFLFFLSALGTSMFGRLTLYSSIDCIGAAKGSQLSGMQTLFTVLFALLILQEVLSPWQYMGIVLILIGVYLVSSQTSKQEAKVPAVSGQANIEESRVEVSKDYRKRFIRGILLGLLSAMLFGVGNVFRKAGLDTGSAVITGAFVSSACSVILYVVFFLLRGGTRDFKKVMSYPFSSLRFYFYDGLFTTAAWLTLFVALTLTTVSSAQALKATNPVVTFFLSMVFLRKEEEVNWLIGLSAMLICMGVAFLIIF